MTTATATNSVTVTGTGLITGLPVTVELSPLPAGSGVVFDVPAKDGTGRAQIPARLEAIVDANRGVTLGHPTGSFVSIVEHFLCACAISNRLDLMVTVNGAPELPLMDGSSAEWLPALMQLPESPTLTYTLDQAVRHNHSEHISVYAIPSDRFEITYAVDFDHPELCNRWIHWDSADAAAKQQLATARTFGFVRDLPMLQAQGLAKGVSLENTLGLLDDGGFTTPLRFDLEPVTHKALDLIGDLTLMGLNPLHISAHIFAFNAGHPSHTAFAKKLKPLLENVRKG